MRLEQLVPAAAEADVDSVLDALSEANSPLLAPFAPEAVSFCDAVARAILRSAAARAHPALVALAYWMRRASITRLRTEFAALETDSTTLVPRGLAFHIPPTNVDTMFVYSLVISLLVGNRNLVRVSRTRSEQMQLLLNVLDSALADPQFGTLRDMTRIVGYGHEDEISIPLSLAADVRVIWGGDGTVAAIRNLPARPATKDLAFADRYSLAAVDVKAYARADADVRTAVAHQLYNDAYWFDQMACSSPRLLVWTGEAEGLEAASTDLWQRVQAQIDERGYRLPTGAVTAKLGFIYGAAIDRDLRSCRQHSNELAVLRVSSLDRFDRTHPGAGTFFEAVVGSLSDLAGFVARKDQTLAVFGQPEADVEAFVRAANGRGVDRIVPIGQALAFGRFWDGYDLFEELTRRIHVPLREVSAGAAA